MARPIKKIFLFKLIASLSAILAISFVAILIYSGKYLDAKARGAVEAESVRALSALQSYVDAKAQTAKRALASLYNNRFYNAIPAGLKSRGTMRYAERAAYLETAEAFLQAVMNSDKDAVNVALYSDYDDALLLRSRGASNAAALAESLRRELAANWDGLRDFGATLLPAYRNESQQYRQYLLPVYGRVKDLDMQGDLGCLMIDFALSGLDTLITGPLDRYPQARFYILDGAGAAIYDSAHELSPPDLPRLARASGFDEAGSRYVGVERDEARGLTYVGVFPAEELKGEIARQKAPIYTLISLLAAAAMALTALFVRHYYQRIYVLCDCIAKMGSGDLTVRAPVAGAQDEVALIAENLNELCDRLVQTIGEAYHSGIESQKNEMLRKDAELKLANAELYALQTQINPHFLYNALESIRMRACSLGCPDVARMAYILSELFRYSLKRGLIVRVDEEVEMCRMYFQLSQLRYPDRLTLNLAVDEGAEGLGVPRHVLQPIVENALKHGVDLSRPGNRVDIGIRREADELLLRVEDDGRGMEEDRLAHLREDLRDETLPEARKIGLRNVHLRIARLFGPDYGLTVDSRAGQGTAVCIRLPALPQKEMSELVQRLTGR